MMLTCFVSSEALFVWPGLRELLLLTLDEENNKTKPSSEGWIDGRTELKHFKTWLKMLLLVLKFLTQDSRKRNKNLLEDESDSANP